MALLVQCGTTQKWHAAAQNHEVGECSNLGWDELEFVSSFTPQMPKVDNYSKEYYQERAVNIRILALKSVLPCLFSFLASTGAAQASVCSFLTDRVHEYRYVSQKQLKYDGSQIFRDPVDTEIFTSLAIAAAKPGDVVLDLGSGSGIATAAVHLLKRAQKTIGVDISELSVAHARREYSLQGLSFVREDMSDLKPPRIGELTEGMSPSLIMSNPPYVPTLHSVPSFDGQVTSGGTDGLAQFRKVFGIAREFKARFAVVIGSYSSPLKALEEIEASGYEILEVHLAMMPFGNYSKAQIPHLKMMEQQGTAVLNRRLYHDNLGYAAIGIFAGPAESSSPRVHTEFKKMLKGIRNSTTAGLELLERKYSFPVRVLVLPEAIPSS